MPPSIVITEPVPRWKAWAYHSLRVGTLLMLCAASFYAGVRYARQAQPDETVQPAARDASEPVLPVVEGALTPAQSPAEDPLAVRALEGLQIQSLNISGDPMAPGQLRYEFEVLNEGRLYEGSFELVVLGLEQGRQVQWVYPSEDLRGRGVFRLRVARYLKTAGTAQLPPGLTPQAVVLRLSEPAGVRASRGIALPGEGAAAVPAPVAAGS